MPEVSEMSPAPPATREELDGLSGALREALARDREERLDQFARLDSKLDARFDEINRQFSSFSRDTGELASRVGSLKDEIRRVDESRERETRERDREIQTLRSGQNANLKALEDRVTSTVGSVQAKQDRNWSWIMGIVGAVLLMLLTSVGTLLLMLFQRGAR